MYEGLFILNTTATTAKEDGLKEVIDKISAEITSAGAKVETVQKMDKKQFARVRFKKHTAGFYVNIIFQSSEAAIAQLRTRFALSEDVFRVNFFIAQEPQAEAAAAAK